MGVYSGNGTELLAVSDNDADSLNAQVELVLPADAAQEYWVVVRGAGSAVGPYGIELFGQDQPREEILVGGLSRVGNDTFSLGVTATVSNTLPSLPRWVPIL